MGRQHRHPETTEEAVTRRPFRYELAINDEPQELPAGKILHLTEYRKKNITGERQRIEVWVEITLDGPDFTGSITNTQHVQVIGTGHPIPDGSEHLASCLDGPFVWHLYQVKEKS